jgi:hypothetical protein
MTRLSAHQIAQHLAVETLTENGARGIHLPSGEVEGEVKRRLET